MRPMWGRSLATPVNHIFTVEQDRLFENDGTGRFVDITTGHLPQVVDGTFGASVGEADGDGDRTLSPATLGTSC